jgi:hypothetical protein
VVDFEVLDSLVLVKLDSEVLVFVLVVQNLQCKSHMPANGLSHSGQNRVSHASELQPPSHGLHVELKHNASGRMFSMKQGEYVDVSVLVETLDDLVLVLVSVDVEAVLLLDSVVLLDSLVLLKVVSVDDWVVVMSSAQIRQVVSHRCS